MKKSTILYLIIYTIVIFTIGIITQIETSKNRMLKVSNECEWGDSDYETVWYIITGNNP